MTMTRFEWASVLSLRKGAWGKNANHRVLEAVAKELFEKLDETNALFEHLYPEFCGYFGTTHDVDYGTKAHMRKVWLRLKSEMLDPISENAFKRSRWWCFELKGFKLLTTRGGIFGLLMLLVYVGWKRGWWKTFRESPLYASSHAAYDAAMGADLPDDAAGAVDAALHAESADEDIPDTALGDGDATAERKSAVRARKDVQEQKRNAFHAMHFAAQVIARPISRKLFTGIVHLSHPIQATFTDEMLSLKTRWGTKDLHCALAQGSYASTIHKVIQTYVSPAFARSVGCDGKPASAHMSEERAKVSSALWRVVVGTANALALTNLAYTHLPPLCFHSLVDQADVVKASLPRFAKMWAALQRLEKTALEDKHCAAFVLSLRFPVEEFCRGLFVMLDETRFKYVQQLAREEVDDFAKCPKSTHLIENMGNLGRQVERKNSSGKLAPLTAWHRMFHSTLLEEFDLPPIKTTGAAESAAPKIIAKSVFEAEEDDCTIPDNLLDHLHSKDPSWPAQGPLQRRQAGLRWAAAVSLDGDWTRISKSWWSCWQTPGTVTRLTGATKGTFVLSSGVHGFLGWEISLVQTPAGISVVWPSPTATSIEVHVVEDPTHWKVIPVSATAPGDSKRDPTGALTEITPLLVDKSADLLEFCARQGLRGHTLEQMRRAFDELKVPFVKGFKPKDKASYSQALIRHLIPGCTDDQLKAALKETDVDPHDDICPGDAIFEPDALGLALDELGDEDLGEALREFKEKAKRHHVAKAKAKLAHAKLGLDLGGGSGAAGSGGSAGTSRILLVAGRGLTQKEGKCYLPPMSSLRKDNVRDPRWQIRAEYLVPSVSSAFVRDDEADDNKAFLVCLRRAWDERTRQFGDKCPYNLDGPLL